MLYTNISIREGESMKDTKYVQENSQPVCEHYTDSLGNYMGNDMCFCPGCGNKSCQRSIENEHFRRMREYGKKWGKYDIYSISDFASALTGKESIRIVSDDKDMGVSKSIGNKESPDTDKEVSNGSGQDDSDDTDDEDDFEVVSCKENLA